MTFDLISYDNYHGIGSGERLNLTNLSNLTNHMNLTNLMNHTNPVIIYFKL